MENDPRKVVAINIIDFRAPLLQISHVYESGTTKTLIEKTCFPF